MWTADSVGLCKSTILPSSQRLNCIAVPAVFLPVPLPALPPVGLLLPLLVVHPGQAEVAGGGPMLGEDSLAVTTTVLPTLVVTILARAATITTITTTTTTVC